MLNDGSSTYLAAAVVFLDCRRVKSHFRCLHLHCHCSSCLSSSINSFTCRPTDINRSYSKSDRPTELITLSASSGKRNVTVWRPSVRLFVCPSRGHTHRDSSEGSMRRGQHTSRPDNKENRHTCSKYHNTINADNNWVITSCVFDAVGSSGRIRTRFVTLVLICFYYSARS